MDFSTLSFMICCKYSFTFCIVLLGSVKKKWFRGPLPMTKLYIKCQCEISLLHTFRPCCEGQILHLVIGHFIDSTQLLSLVHGCCAELSSVMCQSQFISVHLEGLCVHGASNWGVIWEYKPKGCASSCTSVWSLVVMASNRKMNVSGCFHKLCPALSWGKSICAKTVKIQALRNVGATWRQHHAAPSFVIYISHPSAQLLCSFPQHFPLNTPNIRFVWHMRQTDTLL